MRFRKRKRGDKQDPFATAAGMMADPLRRSLDDLAKHIAGLSRLSSRVRRAETTIQYEGAIVVEPGRIPQNNPLNEIVALMVVQADGPVSWITDCNNLFCEVAHWHRGEFGDPQDPDILTDTLIGKPLDAVVPPQYRKAHRLFHQAFQAHPVPRTMGEGRHTPVWQRTGWDLEAEGLDRILGESITVLIGLSAMDETHTVAAVQPMNVGRSFALPEMP